MFSRTLTLGTAVAVPAVLFLMASRTVTYAAPMSIRSCFVNLGLSPVVSKMKSPARVSSLESTSGLCRKVIPSARFRFSAPQMITSLRGVATSKDSSPSSSSTQQLNVEVLRSEGRIVTLKVGTEGEGTLLQGCQLRFENGCTGVVLYQRTPLLFALADQSPADEASEDSRMDFGSTAILTMKLNRTIAVGDELLGRIVNFRGHPLDGEDLTSSNQRAIFSPSTLQQDLATICKPLHTGFTAIDALTPIGRGQNMLLIGNDNLGRLDIVIDTIVNQGREGVRCVYVSTSGKHEEVVQRLRAAGAMKYTTVVAADASQQQLGESVVAAASGCSIAEFWRGQGWDTLVVVNDLEAHRQFWDYTDRVLIQASPAPRHPHKPAPDGVRPAADVRGGVHRQRRVAAGGGQLGDAHLLLGPAAARGLPQQVPLGPRAGRAKSEQHPLRFAVPAVPAPPLLRPTLYQPLPAIPRPSHTRPPQTRGRRWAM